MKTDSQYEIGIVGLGVMGRNLLLNIADHKFTASGYDIDNVKVETLRKEAGDRKVFCTTNLNDFVMSLSRPRIIILLVPAGPPVDSVISEISALLQPDDILIDSGNSYFKDTDVRIERLKQKGILFVGMGISGGEEGARHGASIMPGGEPNAYKRIKPFLEAVAAKVNNEACVDYLGPTSSGHFVKMVHNGIEYGIMELISESYSLMKLLLGFSDDQLRITYNEWNNTELSCFLIEITASIFNKIDEKTGKLLINEILDVSGQKGTGMWTSQSAMELQVPVPTIDIAVSMRNMSVFIQEREKASAIYRSPSSDMALNATKFVFWMRKSIHASMIITFAQGFALLRAASAKYNYNFDSEKISRIWRGGCIIRAEMLNDIRKAFNKNPYLENLLLDENISEIILSSHEYLRRVITIACTNGIPIPALMASAGYFDAYRSSWLPANLIQAQRDFFGGHTYERIDSKGTYHTEWLNQNK